MENQKKLYSIREIALCGLFAALLAICSWVSVPLTVPVTLQTFAVFAAALILETKCSMTAISVWILLGAVGVPVFSGFKGGVSALAGATGGYILGMLFCPLALAAVQKIAGKHKNHLFTKIIGLLLGMLICYAFGTAWFVILYLKDGKPMTVLTALQYCVFPFILFDCVKMALALMLESRIGKLAKT